MIAWLSEAVIGFHFLEKRLVMFEALRWGKDVATAYGYSITTGLEDQAKQKEPSGLTTMAQCTV